MTVAPTKQFSLYQQDCFDSLTWQSLTQNRRILLCSITRFNSVFLPVYIRSLNVWAEMYGNLGVDQVYLLIDDKKINSLWLANFAYNLPILGDTGLEFTQQLAQQYQLNHHTPEFLSQYWNYQALIQHGEIEQFYQQPVDNIIKQFVRDTKDLHTARRAQAQEKSLYTPLVFRVEPDVTQKIFYYRLHPNVELKQYLIEKTLP